MKKIFFHISFILPLLAFIVHQIVEHYFKKPLPILDNYLDPFCASVLILHALAFERRFLVDWSLTLLDVVIAVVLLAIVSELVFPYFSYKFTSDIWDALSFALGGVWFVLLRRDMIVKENT